MAPFQNLPTCQLPGISMNLDVNDFLAEKAIKFKKASMASTARNNSNHKHHNQNTVKHSTKNPKKTQEECTHKDNKASVLLMEWQFNRKIGAGLANLGNTCYLNSVLQCLSYTAPFAQSLLSTTSTSSSKNSSFCMLSMMKAHLHSIFNKSSKSNGSGVVYPTAFVKNLRRIGKHFHKYRQEDSHEFLRLLLDAMQLSCLKKLHIKNEHCEEAYGTLIHRVFGGKVVSRVACTAGNGCNYVSDSHQPFLDLSLEVGSGINSIKDALGHFTMIETLDASNAWKCEKCKKRSRAQKSLRITSTPNVLILQLKRFKASQSFFGSFGGGGGNKINKHIGFTETLNLSPYASTLDESYKLFAVLVHSGSSVHSGHYYAFVKDPAGSWYEVNDDMVRWVSLSTVLSQKAYILFYSKESSSTKVMKVKEKKKVMKVKGKKKVSMKESLAAPIKVVMETTTVEKELGPKGSSPVASLVTSKPHAIAKKTKTLSMTKSKWGSKFKGKLGKFQKFKKLPVTTTAAVVPPTSTTLAKPSTHRAHHQLKRSEEGSVEIITDSKTNVNNEVQLLLSNNNNAATINGRLLHTVPTWNEESDDANVTDTENTTTINQRKRLLNEISRTERRNKPLISSWDAMLDEGKVKKIKRKKETQNFSNCTNLFQAALDRKNIPK